MDCLIEEGLARRQGQRVIFARDLLSTLRQRDLDDAVAKLSAGTGLAHHPSAGGEYVSGTYRQRVTRASGRLPMIDDGLGFQLVPWRPALEPRLARMVAGRRRGTIRSVSRQGQCAVPYGKLSCDATWLRAALQAPGPHQGLRLAHVRRRQVLDEPWARHLHNAALDELPADYWRWWLAANAPETADTDFTIERFAEGVNKDLAHVFGNLVNRCLAFLVSRFDGVVPTEGDESGSEVDLAERLSRHLRELHKAHLAARIRRAAAEARAIWSLANVYLTEQAPWTLAKTDRRRAAVVTRTGVNLVRVAAVVAWPFIPSSADRVLQSLGEVVSAPPLTDDGRAALSIVPAGRVVTAPSLLFPKIDAAAVARLAARYEGDLDSWR